MRWLIVALLIPCAARADSMVATRLIVAGTLISAADVALAKARIPGALDSLDAALGQTARVNIYAGHPIRADNLGTPVLVKRNQSVALRYNAGTLAIVAEGRALGAGGQGDVIRVLNTGSKTTLTGQILPDGTIAVKGAPCVGC